ncbi:MAG TPA: inositol monophosphatase family protein, partial [Candidatus Paceibacterota bacterium]|nr:inositol monophosphatase family protein [Candidatus Paceibacterota bacterium]
MEGIRTPEFKKELEVAKSIALKAGEIMLKYYDVNVDQQVEAKADQSRVTIADKEINRFVIEELARHFPSDAVIGEEESTGEYGMGRRWICDPVDGTESFIARAGRSMFSLGLVIDGKPVLGVALNPVTGKLFEATKNHGSYCNGERINVSKNIEGGQVGVSDKVRKAATPPEYVKKLVG